MTIEEMDLEAIAENGARLLLAAHPTVVFTSGRRTTSEQAQAMASNVVASGERKWIEKTYVASVARTRTQQWVDSNPGAVSVATISSGLLTVLNALSNSQLAELSKHLSGEAFDVQPVTQNAEAIKQSLRNLPGLSRFLESEGGLVRWHAQF
jgi:hypothetical protein